MKGEEHTHSSHTRPTVRDAVEVDNLAYDTHKAVTAADKNDLSALKAEGAVENGLVVLDGKTAGEDAHLHDHDGHGRAADVLAIEDLYQCMSNGDIGALSTFQLDLFADLDLRAHEELFIFVFVDALERRVELFVALLLGHWGVVRLASWDRGILHLRQRGDSGRDIDRTMRSTAVGICMPSARRQVTSPEAKEHAYPIQFARQNPMAIMRPNIPQRRARSSGLASSDM